MIGKRLTDMMRARGKTRTDVVRDTGIPKSTLSHILNDDVTPSYNNLVKLADYLDVSLDFLTGLPRRDSGQLVSQIVSSVIREVETRYGSPEKRNTQDLAIPVIGKISAGPGIDFTDQGYPVGSGDYYIPRSGDNDPNAYAVIAEGDSMSPKIEAGDEIVASPNIDWQSGDVGVLRKVSGDVLVKKILDKGDHFLLVSLNPAYDPEAVPKSQVQFVHKVVSVRQK